MILFLCTPDFITREREGIVDALEKRTSVAYLDRLYSSTSRITESLNGQVPSLALYPDIHKTYLPQDLHRLNFPTACFQIDAYSAIESRVSVSRLFDLALIFHPLHKQKYEIDGHFGVKNFPHAINKKYFERGSNIFEYEVSSVGRLDGPDYEYRRQAVNLLKKMDITTNDMGRYHPYEEMVDTYSKSRVTVNVSRGEHLQEAHLSCLEIMGAGTLLLTTRDPNEDQPHELELLGYEEDRHFATFESLDELQSKIQYYLAHEGERELMANRARDLTLSKHTYDQRAHTLMEWIEDGIPLQAPARTMPEDEVASIYVDYFSKRGHVDETLYHLRRQREADGSSGRLLSSIGKAAKATVRGWQRALTS